MYKKTMLFLIIGILMLAPIPAFAKGFSGGHSSSHYGGGYQSNGSTYHSGYRSPSPNVGSNSYHNYNNSTPKKSGGFLSHAAAFGAGALLGSMFHPFGGGYGYGGYGGMSQGFSFIGLIIDVIIIVILFKIARRFFFR